ncbi:DNA-binding protein Fis [Halomonadaceae bacterium LMG 33818]|uniref:DNA-binding transcriptional regulator Fis n=1 Tax=Cernens ardua TaxID=3402176 RepID=UPI003EDC5C87
MNQHNSSLSNETQHDASLANTVSSAENCECLTLRETVALTMTRYFNHLEGENVSDLYQMVLSEVEAPLLESVMKYVRGNQTTAAQMLGLNRGTLRKKLKQYGLL